MSKILGLIVLCVALYGSGVLAKNLKCPEPKCPYIPDGVAEEKLTLLPVLNNCRMFVICERGFHHYR